MTATHVEERGAVDPRIARSRAKLMAAAREILVEGGASALTVDAVADRSGVAKSTLYRHWPSRAALVIDVFRTVMPVTDAVDDSLPFEAALRAHVRSVATSFADTEWTRMLPALFSLRQEFPEIEELILADRREHLESFAALLDLGTAQGSLPAGLDPDVVVAALVGPSFMLALIGDLDRSLEAADYVVDRFLTSYGGPRPTDV
ncbi:TetR/AcrR family transcriptional regulator [Desertimonas flava]|uniref:TetR/AcrR family transcriptional regulator n=1 Tax=Desertimonas flava TaxID=2064846 RepID=UPI0013C3FAD2|nr:TetR/AcrR family transcriptional regulator [Desertimonas flava]